MDNVSMDRLDSLLAVVHLDMNSCIKSKIFPGEQTKSGNEVIHSNDSTNPSSYHPIKTFFDLGYYSLTLPYRFARDEFSQYQLKTSATRKIISFIIFMSTLIYYFTSARNRLSLLSYSQAQKSPVLIYFYVAHNIFHFFMIISYYHAIFRKSDGFLKLMRELGKTTLLHSNSIKTRGASYMLHVIYLVGTCLLQVLDYPVGRDRSIITGIMRFFIQLARYTFLLDNDPNITSSIYLSKITGESWTIADYSLGILEIFIATSYTLVSSFFTAAYLHAPISLWFAIRGFVNEVVPQNPYNEDGDDENDGSLRLMRTKMDKEFARITANRIVQKFRELQKLSCLFNHIWGIFYFVAILDYIVWLATDLDAGIKKTDWPSRISSVWHVSSVMLLLFFSSECSRMVPKISMASFRTWLVKYGKQIFMDENELNDLINLVDTQTVGVGIDGLYKIDYPFTGQVTTIIITFFIITLQYDRNADQLA